MQDLYMFLKQKLLEREIKVDDIVIRSGVSRTTVYRMMRGIIGFTPHIRDLFVAELKLNKREMEQLDYYIKMVDVDESQLLAREALKDMIFAKQRRAENVNGNVSDIEFVVYEKERRVLKYGEILSAIAVKANSPGFRLEARVLNCVNGDFLAPLVEVFQKTGSAPQTCIEHLVSFSEGDKNGNIQTLKTVLPLMRFSGYSLFFKNSENICNPEELISNLAIIKYFAGDTEEYMLLSFEENSLSDCYISGEKSLYDFFEKKFGSTKRYYKNIPVRQNDIRLVSETLLALEADVKSCVLKPNPAYHRIPISVYRSMLERFGEENIEKLSEYFGTEKAYDDIDAGIDSLIAGLEERNEFSRKHRQIDVYTMEGLEALARDRRLSDHYEFMPPFTREEVKSILENIIEKSNCPGDKYRLYISKTPLLDNNMIFGSYEKKGIVLEYFDAPDAPEEITSCIIMQDVIAKSFLDFVENYVPRHLAMSGPEAERFIKRLIKTYCSAAEE